jgi:DNA integrity scanning protein DisA with diadenylate cyclase activity
MKNISNIIFSSTIEIIKKINAKAIIIYADLFDDFKALKELSDAYKIVLVTQDKKIPANYLDGIKLINLPKVDLSRIGLIKVSVMMAISAEYVSYKDKIICLSGLGNLGYLDSMMVIDLENESEIIISKESYNISEEVKAEVFAEILALSVEIAKQGRESNPVGTIFVLGDHENVLNLSRQLIMNPFHGHPESKRQILNPKLRETIKEFSSIDGAFVIRGDGILLCAGRHLNTSLNGEELMPGLGCRHVAAAGITALTKSVAIVISESTGSVRIFKEGKIIMEIEKTVT